MMGTDYKAQVPALPAARPRSRGVCPSVSLSPAGARVSRVQRCTLPPRPVHVGRCPWETFHSHCLGTQGPTSAYILGMGTLLPSRPPAQALSHPDLPGYNAWDKVPPAAA